MVFCGNCQKKLNFEKKGQLGTVSSLPLDSTGPVTYPGLNTKLTGAAQLWIYIQTFNFMIIPKY
jgi:hypothetical protein